MKSATSLCEGEKTSSELLKRESIFFSPTHNWNHENWIYSNDFLFFRSCMLMKVSAGRRRTWRLFLRVIRPTACPTKATSSSPPSIISPRTARLAPNRCGTCSSPPRPWSAADATSSATRTIWTRRRMLSPLAKVTHIACVQSCYYPSTGMMWRWDVLLSCLKHIKWIINSSFYMNNEKP